MTMMQNKKEKKIKKKIIKEKKEERKNRIHYKNNLNKYFIIKVMIFFQIYKI